MAHLSSNCLRQSLNFSQYFRNVCKLKRSVIINYNQISVCSRYFSNQLIINTCPSLKENILSCRNLFWIEQKYVSKWTKYSKCGLFTNGYGRKKTRRSNFTEEVKKKFPSNKLRETKRTVKRKIGEIVR